MVIIIIIHLENVFKKNLIKIYIFHTLRDKMDK